MTPDISWTDMTVVTFFVIVIVLCAFGYQVRQYVKDHPPDRE